MQNRKPCDFKPILRNLPHRKKTHKGSSITKKVTSPPQYLIWHKYTEVFTKEETGGLKVASAAALAAVSVIATLRRKGSIPSCQVEGGGNTLICCHIIRVFKPESPLELKQKKENKKVGYLGPVERFVCCVDLLRQWCSLPVICCGIRCGRVRAGASSSSPSSTFPSSSPFCGGR